MKRPAEGFKEFPLTLRDRLVNDQPVRRDGGFVLYWMIAARRPTFNFALDRAVAWARLLDKPLVVLEALRVDYPWASDRLHRFVLDGMAENAGTFRRSPALYYPYVEPAPGAGRGLLEALGRNASVVITDDYPCFFLPRAIAAAGRRLRVRLEAVDSNGLLPLAAADHAFTAAVHYRRHMQRHLRDHLLHWPRSAPFRGVRLEAITKVDTSIERRWPRATAASLRDPRALARLPIDHGVPVVGLAGGHRAAIRRLRAFIATKLGHYHQAHNHPDDHGTSRLSPYLHFGHISAHEIFDGVMKRERWSAGKLSAKASGQREGWWGVGPGAEAFLDQLLVWRELAFNMCAQRPDDYDRFESLPAWALETLSRHESDERPYRYSLDTFEAAATHDPVWNAAQLEMRRTGWFHNYMRMLWGKKILEWSASPREALATMTAIMNRWSLDGRDPNSYAGYMWTLGRFDRPWPERSIYGKVRSMSSAQTVRKVRVRRYLKTYA